MSSWDMVHDTYRHGMSCRKTGSWSHRTTIDRERIPARHAFDVADATAFHGAKRDGEEMEEIKRVVDASNRLIHGRELVVGCVAQMLTTWLEVAERCEPINSGEVGQFGNWAGVKSRY